ncbi:hypothetical protein AGMMS49587_11540 [Spirochaetia bacterium]|nr:hypothetical protein AGMMS49587_11540 [Spirochaetia bacterium]
MDSTKRDRPMLFSLLTNGLFYDNIKKREKNEKDIFINIFCFNIHSPKYVPQ